MKEKLMLLFLLLLSWSTYSNQHNPSKPAAATHSNLDSVDTVLSSQHKEMTQMIQTIKTNTDTIKLYTEPQTLFQKFIENAFLEKSYDFFFGGSDKPGLLPFLLSCVGLVVGLIKLIVLFINFRKQKTGSLQGMIISLLLIVISFLMFVLSNRNFRSDEAILLSKLDDKINALRSEVRSIKPSLPSVKDTEMPAPDFSAQFDRLTIELNDVKKNVTASEQQLSKQINDKGSYGFWIAVNTVLLIIVGLLTYQVTYILRNR